MKNRELFNKTVGILVKAYFEGTLEHNNTCACAVGNLVASNMGYTLEKQQGRVRWPEGAVTMWQCVHLVCQGSQYIYSMAYADSAKEQIDSTGYTYKQTAAIERAFETVGEDPDGFHGLMAVVDVLQEIHECTDEERDEAKARFVKA